MLTEAQKARGECEHGSLRRNCPVCELSERLQDAEDLLRRAHEFLVDLLLEQSDICVAIGDYFAKWARPLPSISEMSGSVPGITEGLPLREYLDEIDEEE